MSRVLYPTKPVRGGQRVMNQRRAGLTTFPSAIEVCVCSNVNSVTYTISVHIHVNYMGKFFGNTTTISLLLLLVIYS